MLNDNELKIIAYLRDDARQSLINISRKADVPLSTVYDKIKQHQGKSIKRFTSLLNFPQMGYNIRTSIMVKGNSAKLEQFLMTNSSVNSLCKLNQGYDYHADCIFKHMQEMKDFVDQIKKNSDSHEIFFVVDELRREDFLNSQHFKTNVEGK